MRNLIPTYKQYKKWTLPNKLTFIGTSLGFLSLGFAIATFFLSEEILNLTQSNIKRITLNGYYTPVIENSAFFGNMIITRETKSSFRFKINTINGMHTCHLSGVANVDERGNAKYINEEGECIINFDLDRKKMIYSITYEGCQNSCGLQGYFDLPFAKQEDHLVKVGVMSEINADYFRYLTGRYYGMFKNSMSQISELEDLDYSDSRVHSGSAAGLYATMGSIIMENDDGEIWAAVVDVEKDEVLYFCNSRNCEKWIPDTITEWKKKFDKMKLVYKPIKGRDNEWIVF